MISGSSEFNKNKDNNNKAEICATVCNVLCVQRSVAHFKGSVNALQKCCASVARHLGVRVCVCVYAPTYGQCQAAVAATASWRRFAMQMPSKWRLATVDWRLATRLRSMLHAACCLPLATCHLPRHLVTVSVSPSGAKFKQQVQVTSAQAQRAQERNSLSDSTVSCSRAAITIL